VRRGPVTVVHLPAAPPLVTGEVADDAASSSPPVRAAFGVSRKVGNAVVRNRVRRRLRSVLRELDREGHGAPTSGLAPGTYLVTVRPEAANLPYAELHQHVAEACRAVAGRGGR
jgi:ribonuclease P protein component